jgi:peptidyl-prolyl cis-trans isomerase B (cyclophilin B)
MKRITLILTVLISITMTTESMAQKTKLTMKTSLGDITFILYDDTPMHRDNFIELVNKKFYDGILFHRVIPKFMIQAGDPNSKTAKAGERLGTGTPGYTIPAEFRPGLYHKKGAIAAARIGGPSNPNMESSGSQFYIVVGQPVSVAELDRLEQTNKHPKFTAEQRQVYTSAGGYPWLDYQYTVFGEVTAGMDVVEKISQAQRDPSDRPLNDIKILSVNIVK